MAQKSLDTGEDINDMPESMRQMPAMESGKGFGYLSRSGLLPYSHQEALGEGGDGKTRK
jgi:hypothetical protein